MAQTVPVESVRRCYALAERRRKYFAELHRTERWRRYYGEEAFRAQMKDVVQNVETWGKVLETMTGSAPATGG
jgi:hypothetical protein